MRGILGIMTAVIVGILIAGCSGASSGGQQRITLDISASAAASPRTIEVPLGTAVTLEGTSEVTSELHVHGYEEHTDLVAGEKYTLTFTADMAGVYEIETHDPDAVQATLSVK